MLFRLHCLLVVVVCEVFVYHNCCNQCAKFLSTNSASCSATKGAKVCPFLRPMACGVSVVLDRLALVFIFYEYIELSF